MEYYNDGKQKEQSHEGRLTLSEGAADWSWSTDLVSYGPNKAHVDMWMRAALDSLISEAQRLRASLDLPSA